MRVLKEFHIRVGVHAVTWVSTTRQRNRKRLVEHNDDGDGSFQADFLSADEPMTTRNRAIAYENGFAGVRYTKVFGAEEIQMVHRRQEHF